MDLPDAALSEAMPDAPPRGDGIDWTQPQFEQQLAMLGELAELGMAVARTLQERIAESAEPEALSLAFDRAARAVRMTFALRTRLIETADELARDRKAAAEQVARSDARDREAAQEARRDRIGRIVWRVAADPAGEDNDGRDEESVQRMIDEAHERMEDEDLFGDLMNGPVSDLVERICRDLGLSPDWPRLAEEAWAKAEMQSGEVGTPLKALSPRMGERVGSGGGGGSARDRFAGHVPSPIQGEGSVGQGFSSGP